ncbi:arylamine N-acetyltransferase family protein [Aspergillus mulundensis]|uniref:Uncharacterized protein n=1 Tax=Aspergillus mulundensis TaxID=1810919 RepID=A0A3D8QW69_9EURO|nr:Uncharacterized protein DSM5745_09680 [Aspergillus mulundensis]RDW65941.1 Uncharacterized protein DSM5745_09680 [Aspergillus mulundensis]
MPAYPPTLGPAQLEQYLQRIKYADDAASPRENGHPRLAKLRAAIDDDPLQAFTELQRRHLGSITWGNTALHYSTHHSISIHPSSVFEKLIVRGHDGYCMENTNLLYIVVRSLGYNVYPTGGRVSRAVVKGDPAEQGYISLSHMVLILTIDGKRYMVDVGLGRNTPTSPLLLQEGSSTAQPLIAPSEMRLIKRPLAEFVDQTQTVWIYQARNDPQSPWIAQYSFSEVEFLFQDFSMINFFTSTSRSILFTQKLACTRVILDDEEGDHGHGGGVEPIGIYILAGREVKRVLRGKTKTVQALNTEMDRVRALQKYFNMQFYEHEVEGIRGLSSEIRSR